MSVNTVKQDGSLQRIAGGTLYADAPIGAIMPYGGATAPSGWLLCQGQAISRITYAELFNVIGTAYGSGDGSTTFNVPDLREATTKGAGLSAKSSYHYDNAGIKVGQYIGDRLKYHDHNVYVRDTGHSHSINYVSGQFAPGAYGFVLPYSSTPGDHSTNSGSANIQVNSTSNFTGTANTTSTAGTGSTIEVKAVGVNYIIKAKQVAVPTDFMDAIDDVLEVSEPISATNTEYTTNGSIIWKRSGNVVEVTFLNVAFASQTSGDVTLATGLPPSKNYSWSVIKSLTDASVQQGVAVNTNGNLTSIGGSTGGSSYYDSFTYLAAD